jgi:hypothetical protein
LTGVGQVTTLLLPAFLSFSLQPVGIASSPMGLTLSNMAGVPVTISGIKVSGDFAVSSTTCGSSLGPLTSCAISVTFKPTASGMRVGQLTVTDNANNAPQQASLSGIGTVLLALSPSSLSFPAQLVGSSSVARNFALANETGVAVSISNIKASGDFAVASHTCGSSLGPLARCAISVTFKPATTGSRTGTLMVTDNAQNSPQMASLSGTGTWITSSPATLVFGPQRVGTTSAPMRVTFTNRGTSLIFISNVSASGDFAASSTTCGSSLGAGSSCGVSVTFVPKVEGKRTGALTIDTPSPVPTVGLSGIGTLEVIPQITGMSNPILVGASFNIAGTNFTRGSKVNFFVATSKGPVNAGPFTPISHTSVLLTVGVPDTTTLGQGFVSVQVVNTDTGFKASNLAYALLQGSPAAGIPTIRTINGVGLAATSSTPSFATNNVETVVPQGTTVRVGGTTFDVVKGVALDLFCACPGGKLPTFFLNPGNPGLTATQISVFLPARGSPNSPPTGPGSFLVSNAGAGKTFAKKSNAVSVPIGARITVTSVSQSGTTITAHGTGFSTLTVINFFATATGGGLVNFGGLDASGNPKIALKLISANEFTFSRPAGALAGAAFVEALNPPYVPFTTSGTGPGGMLTLK